MQTPANPETDAQRLASPASLSVLDTAPDRRVDETVEAKDTLTGLSSREAATEWLARQSTSHTRAAIYLDLDGFTSINDRHSRAAGDRVLATVAERLRGTVDDSHMIARLGDDQFVVLLNDVTEADLARTIARIRQRVDQPVGCKYTEIPCTASFGASVALPGDTGGDLIGAANRGMYREKRLRRGL